MKIFILAGGFGTRLKSVVNNFPKPMAPIDNKPFLDFQIDHIRKYFPDTKIYLLTHYLSHIIEEYYKNDSYIKIIKENSPLGTGGSIKHAIEKLNLNIDSKLLILNGDTFIEPNLLTFIKQNDCDISLLASFQQNCSRYGSLNIQNDIITQFKEKNKNYKDSYINAGCYLFNNLKLFSKSQGSFALESLIEYSINNAKIKAFKYNGIFIDIGIPEDYEKMKKYIGQRFE